MLSILAWNIRQGGGTRIPEFLAALSNESPDILVLSQFMGLYFPHSKKHKVLEFLAAQLDDETPSIITGDWNTGNDWNTGSESSCDNLSAKAASSLRSE